MINKMTFIFAIAKPYYGANELNWQSLLMADTMPLMCQWKYPVGNLSGEVGTKWVFRLESHLFQVIVDAWRRIRYLANTKGEDVAWVQNLGDTQSGRLRGGRGKLHQIPLPLSLLVLTWEISNSSYSQLSNHSLLTLMLFIPLREKNIHSLWLEAS